jgi:hypothetical protein
LYSTCCRRGAPAQKGEATPSAPASPRVSKRCPTPVQLTTPAYADAPAAHLDLL